MLKSDKLKLQISHSKTMDDLYDILGNEKVINNYMKKYNGIYLKDRTYYTKLNSDNQGEKANVEMIQANAVDAINNIVRKVVFEKNATPEQKEDYQEQVKYDEQRIPKLH